MDDYGVSLGVPTAASPNAVGEKQQPNQQKKQKEKRKKKQEKKHFADSHDLAIISGQTIKTKSTKETKYDGLSEKGGSIDIQV